MANKNHAKLLNNLRILSCVEPGEYISIDSDNNIYCRWGASWWNTVTSAMRLETFNQTYECLKEIYCVKLPEYILIAESVKDSDYVCDDLLRNCKRALVGLERLKNVYSYAYQTKNGGTYDSNFDTLIESFAKLQIKQLKRLMKRQLKRKKENGETSSDSDETMNLDQSSSEKKKVEPSD